MQFLKSRIVIYIVLGTILLGSVGAVINAATPRPTGTVVVTAYDVTGGTRKTLGGVTVHINSLNYPIECYDSRKTTDTTPGSNHGKAHFTGCPAGSTITNRKYQKFVVINATRSGYQLAHNSPYKIGADKSASKGGSFAVRKNRKTFIKLFLVQKGSAATPPPAAISTPGGSSSPNDNSPVPCGVAMTPVRQTLAGLYYPDAENHASLWCKENGA